MAPMIYKHRRNTFRAIAFGFILGYTASHALTIYGKLLHGAIIALAVGYLVFFWEHEDND